MSGYSDVGKSDLLSVSGHPDVEESDLLSLSGYSDDKKDALLSQIFDDYSDVLADYDLVGYLSFKKTGKGRHVCLYNLQCIV